MPKVSGRPMADIVCFESPAAPINSCAPVKSRPVGLCQIFRWIDGLCHFLNSEIMAGGSIIENMSSRKLGYVLAGASGFLLLCFLLGALVSPTPNASMQYLATKCVDKSGGVDRKSWFWPRGKGSCQRIERFDDPEASKQQLTADHIGMISIYQLHVILMNS